MTLRFTPLPYPTSPRLASPKIQNFKAPALFSCVLKSWVFSPFSFYLPISAPNWNTTANSSSSTPPIASKRLNAGPGGWWRTP